MNLNKDTVIGGAVVLVLVVLGWLMLNGAPADVAPDEVAIGDTQEKAALPPPPPPPAAKKTAAPPPAAVPANDNTFKSIFAEKGSYKCEYDTVESSSRSTNTVYIGDQKMRAEFRSMVVDKRTSNMMVYDGIYLYTWEEGQSYGTKSRLTSVSELPAAIPKDLTSAAVLGSGLSSASWNCHPWIKDASLLKAPSYVTFN